MAISGLDHINVDTSQPAETVAFYTEVLGLEAREGARPNFDFPGEWLWLGDRALVHLNFHDELPTSESTGKSRTGAFNHIAFEGSGFTAMCALLDEREMRYSTSERPEIDLKQIFVRDPNGVRIEINIRGEC